MTTQKIRADTQIEGAVGGNSFNDAEGDPTKVAETAADGTSTYAARRDHVHDGGWVLIQSIELGSDTPTLDFTSIPATYKALKVIIDTRSDRAGVNSDGVKVKFNNDTGNNYVGQIQWGSPTPGWTQQNTAGAPFIVTYTSAATSTANYFSNMEILIPAYANTNKFKSFQCRGMQMVASGSNIWVYDAAGLYLITTAISRVTFFPEVGSNFKTNSTGYLFGLK